MFLKRIVFCLAAMIWATSAFASSFDGQPKILLHAKSVIAKNACTWGALADCGLATVSADVGPYYYVYLIVSRGSYQSLDGALCGITYDEGAADGASNHRGVDVFAWDQCVPTNYVGLGWPNPGGFSHMIWSTTACATGESNVAGYFYVGAYSPDVLKVAHRPGANNAVVANCQLQQTDLDETALGSVAFSAGAAVPGCNPCLSPCSGTSGVPAISATWSQIKNLWR